MISRSEVLRSICAGGFVLVAITSAAQTPEPQGQTRGEQETALLNGLERRLMDATRLDAEEVMTLDGRLDEPVWRRAAPARDFVQIDPRNGQPATEPTEVRIAFSRDA